jgi:hypothetical protein
MFEHLDDADPPQPGPLERARVFSRAAELVQHRRLVIGLCVAVIIALIAAIPGVLTAAGGTSKRVHTAAAPATTPTTSEGTSGIVNPITGEPIPGVSGPSATPTTAAPQVLGSSVTRPPVTSRTNPPSPTGGPQPGDSARSAQFTSSGTPCRNSSDPACGPFYWDPDPGPNEPLTGQVTFEPANPKAGDTVTFHITANDPDDGPLGICSTSYGDGANVVCDPIELMDPDHHCPKQYGPWTPPARKQGAMDTHDVHTYNNAGTYNVSFDTHSGSYCSSDPYASRANLTATVVVS